MLETNRGQPCPNGAIIDVVLGSTNGFDDEICSSLQSYTHKNKNKYFAMVFLDEGISYQSHLR